MTATPKTLNPDWQAIRLAAVRGVSDQSLAEAFGVSREAIRQRRSREKWPGREKRRGQSQSTERKVSLAESGERADELATVSLSEIGERNALLVARETARLIEKAFKQGMPVPDQWSELVSANKLVESATGRSREGVSVALTWGAFWQTPGAEPQERPIVLDVGH